MKTKPMELEAAQIKFGTDGWRGILGVDITLEKLLLVSIAATQEMLYRAPKDCSRKVVIGYDRRFLAPEFSELIAASLKGLEVEPLLADVPVPTPSCSWAVVENKALGALVITASHNPPEWLGLKIKSPRGGSVDEDFTKAVERRLASGVVNVAVKGGIEKFSCRKNHLLGLKRKVNIPSLVNGLKEMGLKVIVDPMHGSAAGCMKELLGEESNDFLKEIRTNRDPLFGGTPPEPLERNLKEVISILRTSSNKDNFSIGLVFDGDGDRIAAIDEKGRFCSTQLLLPIFIEHLAGVLQLPGCVVKTVSGSDSIRSVAEKFGREVIERPVGFKYIAHEMLNKQVLLGGEESGGIGFGDHLPERDALYAALLLLEYIVHKKQPLGVLIDNIQKNVGDSFYKRVDLDLVDEHSRQRIENYFKSHPLLLVGKKEVQEIVDIDGFKLIFGQRDWLMFRFSGTEPLLRIYCESTSIEDVQRNIDWAREFALNI